MRILIADKFEAWGVDQLRSLASELALEPDLKDAALAARVAEFKPDIIVVRSTKIPAATLEKSDGLQLVIRAGSGVDNIDVEAASRLGVLVANCPGMNAIAVAELTMGLLISLDRRIPDNVIDLRAHKWNKKEYSKARGLKGQTLGIIGAGRIGTEVARRAAAFEMHVLYFHLGRTRRLSDFPNCKRVDIDELVRQSDYITIHVPGGDGTTHLLDAKRIQMMKSTAVIVNTSRAGVLDEPALIAALKAGHIRGAAVDVFENEPGPSDTECHSPLCDTPRLYGTHHIGASTDEAQMAVAEETVRIVREFKATNRVINCVNLRQAPAAHLMIVKFHNKPGGLAHVFAQLAAAEINVEEMDHVIYDGGLAACAHIRLDKSPTPQTIDRIESHANVMGVEMMTE